MKIVVITGMPLSGKSIGRIWASRNGVPYIATGDIVRAEAEKRGIPPEPENLAALSDELRGADGTGVTRMALEKAMESGSEIAVLDGMRSLAEVEILRQKADVLVVAIVAGRGIRRQRLSARGRSDDTPEAFEERNMRELSYGLGDLIAMADAYICNEDIDIENAVERLERILENWA